MAQESNRTIEHDFDVVGLGFRLKKDVRAVIAGLAKNGGIPVDLQREPDNRSGDTNALMVVGIEGELAGVHIGYLRAPAAAEMSPRIDAGEIALLSATINYILPPEHKQGTVSTVWEDLR